MAYPDIATKDDLAKELAESARTAAELEELVRYVEAILVAVNDTDLLDKAPADERASEKHNAACTLLSDLQRRLAAHEEREGTDLSITLDVLAMDVREGRFSHRRVNEPEPA